MGIYVADFETTTDADDCRVWGWGIYNVDKNESEFGNNIDSFMAKLLTLPNSTKIYFHNLKFDGEFILYYLKNNNFEWTDFRQMYHKEFNTLITDKGVFYSIAIQYENKKITIYDSLKIIPLPVAKISKAFGIEQLKGEIDYTMYRPVGYKLTKEEIEYIRNDIEIVGKALSFFTDQGLKKMTQASNAFYDFKSHFGDKFEKIFPILQDDSQLRKSYKGGFTWVNPKYKGNVVKEGIVLDVNSLYPSVMYNCKLPYGEPIYYDGEYEEDFFYTLYIQVIRCTFDLKKGKIPTIQLKQTLGFMPTEYVESSGGQEVELNLTSVDLKLFLDHYDVGYIDYICGWKFKGSDKYFKPYIDKWIAVKNQATIDKNEGLRTIAKLMLNALYGRFALNPKVVGKKPVWEGEWVKYEVLPEKQRDPVYVSVASFITSYAREVTIRSAQANYHRFIYADTDSLHLVGKEAPENIEVDPVKLGAWKEEYKFNKGKFLRAKAYIEEMENGENHIACAGLPHRCHSYVTFENFKEGLTIPKSYILDGEVHAGKLQHKRVIGGVILKEIEYSIKI